MNETGQKTVFITGVCGQIGSYFAEFLLEAGYKVVGLYNTFNPPDFISHKNFIKELYRLLDDEDIDILVKKYKPDYFINCAAISSAVDSWSNSEEYFQVNSIAVLRQLEAIVKYCPSSRYLNFGSSYEFGIPVFPTQNENHPLNPQNPYALSKVFARNIVQLYRKSHNIYAVQCWTYNAESSRRQENYVTQKIIIGLNRIVEAINNKQPFEPIKLGNLDASRDWSHTKDIVDGAWRMLNQDDKNPKDYVLSSGASHTVMDFLTLAVKEIGLSGFWRVSTVKKQFILNYLLSSTVAAKSEVIFETDENLERDNDLKPLIGDSSAIRKDLGWKPKISFDTIVKSMIKESNGKTRPQAK